MHLVVTEKALKELEEYELPAGQGVRINAELVGG
jgi:hypothetical protein